VVVLGGLVVAIFRAKEPRYEGRSLSEWLEEADKDTKSEADLQSIRHAVKQMAPDAIPLLLKWVQAEDSPLKWKVIVWLTQHPSFHFPIKTLKSAADYNRMAFTGFTLLGEEARPAWPTLIRWTYDTSANLRFWAFDCLVTSNPEKEILLPVLLRLIRDPTRGIQTFAAHELADRFPQAAAAAGVYETFPYLKKALASRASANQVQGK